MDYCSIDARDIELIQGASRALEANYDDPRHTVSAAVRCSSGKVYVGVNVESCGYGPCAEPIAIGRAITDGERSFEAIVALGEPREPHRILPPCGNCRQLLYDYAPDCWVILSLGHENVKLRARDLIPHAYGNFE